MKDRIAEHPNRYRLVAVDGEPNVYDLVPEPGEVTEPGTAINKANLLTDETAAFIGLTEINPSPNDAFKLLGTRPVYTDDLHKYFMGGILTEFEPYE